MKAFIGHSFDDRSEQFVRKVKRHLDSLGIECLTGEKAQNSSVAEKVKKRILECDIFVGILTRENEVVFRDEANLNQKKSFFGRRETPNTVKKYTTSNWVIQESGFAIGKDKHLILFVENNINKFPELQGDLEVIKFKSNFTEAESVKLNEMITNIKTKSIKGEQDKPDETKSMESPEVKKAADEPKKGGEAPLDIARKKMNELLFKDKKFTDAINIFKTEVEPHLETKREKLRQHSTVLKWSRILGDSNALKSLQTLAVENNNNPIVVKQLAHCYRDVGENKKAIENYELAISKCDLDDEDSRKDAYYCHTQAAICRFRMDDDYIGAISSLRQVLSDPNFKNERVLLLISMADISKDAGRIEDFFAYGEAALDIDPLDTKDFRFRLAYGYSNAGHKKLALLHYKKLKDIGDNSGLNNLGVGYSAHELNCKAVQNYIKASENGETLAMANLCYKYLNEGFLDEAKNLVEKARKLGQKGVNVHVNISGVEQKIGKLSEEENEKEKVLFAESEKERRFRVKYSHAFLSDKHVEKSRFEGSWDAPEGVTTITFDKITGSFQAILQKEVSSILAASLGGAPSFFVTKKITGVIEGLSGRFEVESQEESKTSGTILSGSGTSSTTTGLMVINESIDRIDVMEIMSDDKTTFAQWIKQSCETVVIGENST